MQNEINGDTTVKQKNQTTMLLGIVLSVLTYWLFAQSIVNVVPDIQKGLNIDASVVSLAVSLTSLFSGMFVVLAGYLADRVGRVKATYAGLFFSLLGSLLISISTGAVLLIVGRIVQGLSAALIMPATLAIIKSQFKGDQRKTALSYWSMGSWGGSGICAFAGGAIATFLSWRWIFIFGIIFTLVAMLLLRGTPESKIESGTNVHFDFIGLIFFLVAILSINIFLSKGAAWGWGSLMTLSLLLIAAVVGAFFYIAEKRNKTNPFIDFKIFKNRRFTIATISNFALNAVAGSLVIINTFMQKNFSMSPLQSGSLSIPYFVTILISIRVGEKLINKRGYALPMICGGLVAGVGTMLSGFTFLSMNAYLISAFLGYALLGVGLGLYATPSTDMAVSNVPDNQVGTASGIYKMASSLGGGIGNAASLAIFVSMSASGLVVSALWSIMFSAVLCLIPAILVFVGLGVRKSN